MEEETIETLDDWNKRLAGDCCCTMPECPEPTKDCESIYSEFHTDYDAGIGGGLTNLKFGIYRSYTTTLVYENCSESSTTTYATLIDEPEDCTEVEGPDADVSSTEPEPCEDTDENPKGEYKGIRYTGAVKYTPEAWLADVLPFQTKFTFTDPKCRIYPNLGCTSRLAINTEFGSAYYTAYFTLTRFRWKIPDRHEGSYFKITWDILNEPFGWNAEKSTGSRTYFLEDQTYEWSGAAGGGTDRYSEWYVMPTPDFNGERRVVNVRFECYRSENYGNKPQVTGEAVTLPDPKSVG
jgi:hypothetical protein